MALKEHDAAWRRHLYLTLIRKRVRPGSGSSQEFLRARTWRIPVFDLRTLIQTPFVIVGGVATRLYSPERMTDDLDVLILTQNAKAFYDEILKIGSRKQGDLAIPGSHWLLPDGTPLDVLESDETWAQEAINTPTIAPDGLPIIRLPYLILMKLRSSRGIDIGDLTRMLGAANEDDLIGVRSVIATYQPDALEDLESLIQLGRLEYEA